MVAQVVLASASPRRIELLAQIGVRAIVNAVDIDETYRPHEKVLDYVQRLAKAKAHRGYALTGNLQKLPVIGADTIVELDGVTLGKPEDRRHAKTMLKQLSGRKHTVHSSVAIVTENKSGIATSSTQVSFRPLQEYEIDCYLATGEADDKAGAYAIQGIAAQFITNINGSFSGVMGLPLYETATLLEHSGIRLLSDNRHI